MNSAKITINLFDAVGTWKKNIAKLGRGKGNKCGVRMDITSVTGTERDVFQLAEPPTLGSKQPSGHLTFPAAHV